MALIGSYKVQHTSYILLVYNSGIITVTKSPFCCYCCQHQRAKLSYISTILLLQPFHESQCFSPYLQHILHTRKSRDSERELIEWLR